MDEEKIIQYFINGFKKIGCFDSALKYEEKLKNNEISKRDIQCLLQFYLNVLINWIVEIEDEKESEKINNFCSQYFYDIENENINSFCGKYLCDIEVENDDFYGPDYDIWPDYDSQYKCFVRKKNQ